MKIISPKIYVEKFDGKQIMKNIERMCRICYKSEDKITDDSYKNLLKNCINRGHESVLEHEKISIRMICDLGVYKDLTRHRAGASFSIQSTRYCNYSKGKFGSELTFIEPLYFEGIPDDCTLPQNKNQLLTQHWYNAMEAIENSYIGMAEEGAIPDEMRMILPHSIASEVGMTCNIREWKHVLSLRCTNHAHPAIQQILIPLLLLFKQEMPEIFDSVEYNENFPKEKYAELVGFIDS